MATTYSIVKGPSFRKLFEALRLNHKGRQIDLTLIQSTHSTSDANNGRRLQVKAGVLSLSCTSVSNNGDVWDFEIYPSSPLQGHRLKGWYNTKDHKGYIHSRGQ